MYSTNTVNIKTVDDEVRGRDVTRKENLLVNYRSRGWRWRIPDDTGIVLADTRRCRTDTTRRQNTRRSTLYDQLYRQHQSSAHAKLGKQEAFEKKCWTHSPLRAAARPNFTLPFTGCRYCRTPPAHRCPRQRRQQRRRRVTEGTAMAPWNGPNECG